MPLRDASKKRPWSKPEEDDMLRDSPVQMILAEIRKLAKEEDPKAFHLVAVIGQFKPEQVEEIQRHAPLLHATGRLEVLVNVLVARSRQPLTADFYLVDYVIPSGQPKPLLDLIEDEQPSPQNHQGMTREELVERLSGGNGAPSRPQQVEETIQRIFHG